MCHPNEMGESAYGACAALVSSGRDTHDTFVRPLPALLLYVAAIL
jgi:hypothetical protein